MNPHMLKIEISSEYVKSLGRFFSLRVNFSFLLIVTNFQLQKYKKKQIYNGHAIFLFLPQIVFKNNADFYVQTLHPLLLHPADTQPVRLCAKTSLLSVGHRCGGE